MDDDRLLSSSLLSSSYLHGIGESGVFVVLEWPRWLFIVGGRAFIGHWSRAKFVWVAGSFINQTTNDLDKRDRESGDNPISCISRNCDNARSLFDDPIFDANRLPSEKNRTGLPFSRRKHYKSLRQDRKIFENPLLGLYELYQVSSASVTPVSTPKRSSFVEDRLAWENCVSSIDKELCCPFG